MTDGIDVREFLAGYLAESEEHLGSANANLLLLERALKKGENHPRAVRELFRALHTMKGISGMIGAEAIVDIAHEMESGLRTVDRSGARLPLEAIDLLLRGVRAIEERVGHLAHGRPLERAKSLLVELAELTAAPRSAPDTSVLTLPADLVPRVSPGEREEMIQGLRGGKRLTRIDFVPSQENIAAGLTISSVRERVAALGELVKVVAIARPSAAGASVMFSLLLLHLAADDDVARAAGLTADRLIDIRGPLPIEPAIEEPISESEPERSRFVRVDVRRLDETLERLSALVVTHARLAELAKGGDRALGAAVSEASRGLRDLRGAIMRARMVPASDLIDRAPLVVRGLGKRVAVETEASAVELDKTVADRLFPVLVHLLRNAVDHAIEPPNERALASKPETATIRVRCAQRADGFVELSVQDDGRGIDRRAIAQRAGVAVPETDEQLLAILARPGFSTRDVATSVSGRGVGMDIVQRTVLELGGELSLETEPGVGSTFTVQVPVSITIVDVLTFVCAEQTFVVPVRSVERLAETLPSIGTPLGVARLSRDSDRTLALYDLGALLGLAAGARGKVIVVRRGQERFGFGVDRMIGRKEVVMRPIADPLVRVRGLAGTTDLGDGRPTLVLDLIELVRAQEATA